MRMEGLLISFPIGNVTRLTPYASMLHLLVKILVKFPSATSGERSRHECSRGGVSTPFAIEESRGGQPCFGKDVGRNFGVYRKRAKN